MTRRRRKRATKSQRRRTRLARKIDELSEPRPTDDEEWVDFGPEPMLAMGYSGGGAPYGLALSEFRDMNERDHPRAGWTQAKRALRAALRERGVDATDPDAIGWVTYVGEGRHHCAWRASCPWPESPRGHTDLIVRFPLEPVPATQPKRAVKAAQTLEHLSHLDPPWRLPLTVALIPLPMSGLAQVQHFLPGIACDLRADRGHRPWLVVAQVAAGCHHLDPAPHWIPSHATRREHAEAALEALRRRDDPLCAEALAWATQHLPPPSPARLLHGGLHGPNLRLHPNDHTPSAVLGWTETQVGDPAYDLAVAIGGRKRPFQLDNGLQRLLDAYNPLAPEPVTRAEVHIHQLCLLANQCPRELTPHASRRLANLLEHARTA